MEKQNPFSLYDFLGYLVPGTVFLFGSVLLHSVATSNGWPSMAWLHSFEMFSHASLYVPFVFLSYLLGHVISFISAATIERFSIWTIGYPSRFLMGIRKPETAGKL